ncbi:MAG: hypothetical protein R2753_14985 [Chitinophagales bacterium]
MEYAYLWDNQETTATVTATGLTLLAGEPSEVYTVTVTGGNDSGMH